MQKRKKIIISLVIVLIITIAFILFYNFLFFKNLEEQQILERLNNNQELLKKYEEIKIMEEKDKTEGIDAGRLFSMGMAWKSLGDLTKDKFFYQKALAVYQIGIKNLGSKNVLFYWNGGRMAEYLEDYKLAEDYYRESIRTSSGYEDAYKYLADLYYYKLKKDPEEVLKIYEQGLEATMGNASIFLEKCSFLRKNSYYKESLDCYSILSEQYPDNTGFKDVVEELKYKLEQFK